MRAAVPDGIKAFVHLFCVVCSRKGYSAVNKIKGAICVGKFVYMVKRIVGLDYKSLFEMVGLLHKKTGKSRIWLFFDMIHCGLKYGCGYTDYRLFEFYRLNALQRSTFLTRAKNNQIVKTYNQKDYIHILENKVDFNQYFNQYLGRKWIDMRSASREQFAGFAEGLDFVMAKPLDLTGGHGIEKLKIADFASVDAMYDYLKEHNFGLCEQYIVQHPEMAAFNPYSVNTFRICTILTNGEPHVLYFYVRMGNGEKVVDNLHSGGLTCPVDWETGKIKYQGYALFDKYYDVHPNTGHPLVGAQLPFWKEAIDMCFEAAKSLPQVAYVGWDVGITENGPVLIEGNPFPGHDLLQMPPHAPEGIGVLPHFRKYIPNI